MNFFINGSHSSLNTMKPTNRILRIIAVLALLSLSACGGLTRTPQNLDAQIAQAEALAAQGQISEAAERYSTLAAKVDSPERERLQLLAAQTSLTPETLPQARAYLDAIDKKHLDASLGAEYLLTEARLLLIENRPIEALNKLPTQLQGLPQQQQLRILQVRASALFASGKVPQAVQQRLDLEPLLDSPEALGTNRQTLWEELMQASSFDLYGWVSETPPGVLRGWMELAYIVKTTQPKVEALNTQLAPWLQTYPAHPAQAQILPAIRAQWQEYETYPNNIAILLPLSGSGSYASASQAILSGLLAAYYEEADPALRPHLKIYDIGERAEDAYAFYQQAVTEGANFVIGPFNKTSVNALVVTGALEVPTLSLNYSNTDIPVPDNLYQFGLLPEDEARQVAERASLDGHQNVVALVPQGEWGERILSTFQERFEMLGGTVLVGEHFAGQSTDFSASIKAALHLDESQRRFRQVRNTIKRSMHFDPRRRKDVDMIFIAGSPRQARSLRPQLDFHHARGLAVYATSHVYSGVENERADLDLSGLIYCDIPWVLEQANSDPALRKRLDELLPLESRRYPRLVALGLDTYHLVPHLKRLSAREYERFEGFTGHLSIDANRRVHRELNWARFSQGKPQLLGAGQETEQAPEDDDAQ